MATFVAGDSTPLDLYKLMTGLVVPRPIGWIGSYGPDQVGAGAHGTANLAPYSFFNAVSGNPPTVIVSSGVRGDDSNRKDTHANLEDRGEFTVNIVTEELGPAMNHSAAELPPGESEFDLTGLTAVPATVVNAPMVAECPAVFECRVVNRVAVGPVGGPPSNIVFFGQVEVIHVNDEILDGTRIRHDVLRPVGRLAGNGYSTVADTMYELIRPDR